jgi:hypothetical protein
VRPPLALLGTENTLSDASAPVSPLLCALAPAPGPHAPQIRCLSPPVPANPLAATTAICPLAHQCRYLLNDQHCSSLFPRSISSTPVALRDVRAPSSDGDDEQFNMEPRTLADVVLRPRRPGLPFEISVQNHSVRHKQRSGGDQQAKHSESDAFPRPNFTTLPSSSVTQHQLHACHSAAPRTAI